MTKKRKASKAGGVILAYRASTSKLHTDFVSLSTGPLGVARAAGVRLVSKRVAQNRLTGLITRVVDREMHPYLGPARTRDTGVRARFVSGGLPSLGKRSK